MTTDGKFVPVADIRERRLELLEQQVIVHAQDLELNARIGELDALLDRAQKQLPKPAQELPVALPVEPSPRPPLPVRPGSGPKRGEFSCDKCDKVCTTAPALASHKRTHDPARVAKRQHHNASQHKPSRRRPPTDPSPLAGRVRLTSPFKCKCGETTGVSPCWNCEKEVT